MILNCITVDDEPLALELINGFVNRTPFLKLVGTYNNVGQAYEAVSNGDVQIVFLDIHMPKTTGLDMARQLLQTGSDVAGPKVIFTTAHNQYAIQGYKVNAIDYLLKPFEYDEFLSACQKAQAHCALLAEPIKKEVPSEEQAIFVRTGYQDVRVPLAQIHFIKGLRDYATIYLKDDDKTLITLTTLKALEDKLPSDRFIRVQRSYIVAIDAITAISSVSLWLGDTEITIGDKQKGAVRKLVDQRKQT